MWFNRKSKNRRLGPGRVLEVKLRSSQVRAARTRITAITLGTVFATLFSLYLVYRTGEWLLNRLVYENKAFAIEEIDAQTDGIIPLDQVRRWAGVKLEENLLALDLGRVKRDLEMVPLVRSASVERVLPRTLRIRVAEREPIAKVSVPRPRTSGGVEMFLYQLDVEGWVMLPLDQRDRSTPPQQSEDPLPILAGLGYDTLQPGRRLTAPQVQAALQFLSAFEESPMAGLVDLKRVDVSYPEVLLVTTVQGSEVTFGLNNFDQQLRRWCAIFEAGRKEGNVIATLDLAVTNNVPLRWLEASAVPPTPPKASKPPRSRKKHV
jgi:cell division septal protein FtsQ